MKLVSKSALEYEQGYLILNDQIVGISDALIAELNHLEHCIQRARYDAEQPPVTVSEFKPFKCKSIFKTIEVEKPGTPAIDIAMAESIEIMADLERLEVSKATERYLGVIPNVVMFVKSSLIAVDEATDSYMLDLPTIGNPCKMTESELLSYVHEIVG